jgi:hypothetical protein
MPLSLDADYGLFHFAEGDAVPAWVLLSSPASAVVMRFGCPVSVERSLASVVVRARRELQDGECVVRVTQARDTAVVLIGAPTVWIYHGRSD